MDSVGIISSDFGVDGVIFNPYAANLIGAEVLTDVVEPLALDTPLYDHMAEQPLKYANAEGVNWCVLSNGQEWRVYNAFWRIKGIEHKMLFRISIDEFIEKMNKLLLLSKESILSGNLEREGESELAERIVVDWFRQKESVIIKEIMELDPSLKEENVRNALKKITRAIREKIN
jgi:predicted type IV restriction endonuclease